MVFGSDDRHCWYGVLPFGVAKYAPDAIESVTYEGKWRSKSRLAADRTDQERIPADSPRPALGDLTNCSADLAIAAVWLRARFDSLGLAARGR